MRPLSILAFLVLIGVSGVSLAHYQQTTNVTLGDFFFCETQSEGVCETVIASGDAVFWEYPEGTAGHTITACGDSCDEPTDSPLFDAGTVLAGDTFSFTFSEPGEHLYYCEFHAVAMRGSILVQAPQTPTPIEATPTTVPPTPTLTADAPEPNATDDGESLIWLLVPAAVVAALAVIGASLFVFCRSRQ